MLRVFMRCFPLFCSSFLLYVDVRVICSHASHALLGSMCFMCLFPCYMVRSMFSHAYTLGFVFLHAFMLTSTCLDVHSRAYMHISMPKSLDLCLRLFVCLDLFSLHDLCYLPCSCALHAMFVCVFLGYVCHAMCYCSPFVALSSFLVFWPIG